MILYGDYHTHTIYSSGKHNAMHATGTILENALIAQKKSLKEIAITEHGLNHKLYGLQKKNISRMREEIDYAQKITGVKIYLGIEANIISSQGDIDLTKDEVGLFDLIVVGFHKFARAKSVKEFWKFYVPNLLGIKSKKTKERNTLSLMMAMDKYPIDIISHPGVGMVVDFDELSKHAQKTGTHLEINGKRIAYTYQDIQTVIKNGAKITIDSDAHSASRVGEVDKPLNFAIKNGVDFDRIANYGKKIEIKPKVVK